MWLQKETKHRRLTEKIQTVYLYFRYYVARSCITQSIIKGPTPYTHIGRCLLLCMNEQSAYIATRVYWSRPTRLYTRDKSANESVPQATQCWPPSLWPLVCIA